METFKIASVNISTETGVVKTPVDRARISAEGFETDAHAGAWHRQISLLSIELIESFDAINRIMKPGEFAENITTRGLDLGRLAVLDRVRIGEIEMEITQIGKACHSGCEIFKEVGACIMPKEGLFARVIHGGDIAPDMTGEYHPRDLNIRVITLSDRASQGIYTDRSGPRLMELLEDHFQPRRDHQKVSYRLIPDDPEKLQSEFQDALNDTVDLVITTGGTGVGPRDFAPEVTTEFCSKLIPGITDHIRVKYGAKKPGALLSRGVAGIRDNMTVINFPGSVRACQEYFTEFFAVWDHLRRMIHGIDSH